MKTQHTPAPWKTVDSFSVAQPRSNDTEFMDFRTRIECEIPYHEHPESDRPNELIEKQTLCNVYGRTEHEMKANAQLIALAPELLKENEQLKERVRHLESIKYPDLRSINAELLERLEKSTNTFSNVWSVVPDSWKEAIHTQAELNRSAIAKAEGKEINPPSKTPIKQFKVVSISSNTNSFGLSQMILIASDGEAWAVHFNRDLYVHERGEIISLDISSGVPDALSKRGFEVPLTMPKADQKVIDEVWK